MDMVPSCAIYLVKSLLWRPRVKRARSILNRFGKRIWGKLRSRL